MNGNLKTLGEIERSIIKTYRKTIWTRFIKAINQYELLKQGDKIAVAISGGKDSLLLAKCFQELKKHSKFDFELEFIAMDPGYLKANRDLLYFNCEHLGIPVQVYDSDVFEVAGRLDRENPCYMCARMRRGSLYAKAMELGCNKLALGHHFNDAIETILLNVLYAGNYKAMMPKLHSTNFKGMELIRPLLLIEEEYIIRWIRNTGLTALNCACTVTQRADGSKRKEIKHLIADMKKYNKNVDISIFRSAENVALEAIVGWESGGVHHSFLDNYDD